MNIRSRWFTSGVIFTLLFVSPLVVFSQSGQPYKKKVVSFVDRVLAPAGAGLSTEQNDYVLSALSRSINFARFNYAPLPENVTASFGAAASGMESLAPDRITPVLDSTLAPQLLRILDINKELLSKQNLSDEDRNTFLATKAKAAGMSASQLEAILNSGFFYIPYLETCNRRVAKGFREVKNDYGRVVRRIPLTEFSYSVRLGLLWYKLNVDRNNNASVAFAGVAAGWSGEPIVRSTVHEDETFDGRRIEDDGSADFAAFKNAVDASTLNIQVETKKMEAFHLTGEVTGTTFFGVKLNLGSREGVGLDDTYWVEELQETDKGDVARVKRGFVKIREVGDNAKDETAESYAQTITGTGYSEGLSLTELPMLGINGLVSFAAFPVRISTFDNTTSTGFDVPNTYFGTTITSGSKTAYGVALSFQADLANATRVPELWLNLGGAIGITTVDGQIYYSNEGLLDSTDIGPGLTGYVNFGLLKKFYFRRFGLLFQADVKYALTRFTVDGNDGGTYRLTNGNIGLDGRAALEVYITPVLSLGAGAEYNLFGTSSSWSADVTDSNGRDFRNTSVTGPDVKYSGLGFYLWVNYALPSLK